MKPIRTLKGKYNCRNCDEFTKQRLLMPSKDFSIVSCAKCQRVWWINDLNEEGDE